MHLQKGKGRRSATGVVPGFWNPLDTNIVESVAGKSSLISFDGTVKDTILASADGITTSPIWIAKMASL